MTNREHFIAILQACYFGDRNAFKEIIRIYDEKENIIKEVREYIENNELYEQDYDYDYEENLVVGSPSDETPRKILLEILDKENK